MLWSKVKTVFIIAFLILDVAFLALMGITSAGSGLSADELSEIVTLCDRYGITVPASVIPTQTTRLPLLEARFLTAEDLPQEIRGAFVFDGEGRFTYQGEAVGNAPPKDEKAARRLVNDTLKGWGFDRSTVTVESVDGSAVEARAYFSYQNRKMFDCVIDFVLSDSAVVSAEGRWLWDVTVTQGAETIADAPTVLAELIEEESLCHRGLSVADIEIGYLPESAEAGVVHKIFPISPAYRITLSDGTARTYFAFSE